MVYSGDMFRTGTFIPTMRVAHIKRDGFSETGQPRFVVSKTKLGISPIRLETSVMATSIRTDKSGSKGRAEEEIQQGRVLIHPKAEFQIGDLIEVYGIKWRIQSVYPRHDMDGRLSHYQVDVSAWA